MVTRLKLNGIDGKTPLGVESAAEFDSTRKNLPDPYIMMIDILRVRSRFYGWRCMTVLS